MRFNKEIKIGFLAVIGLLMSVFSYNYLKGINLFEKNRKFKVIYNKVDGLSISNPVTLNGFKIGNVSKINFNPKNSKELIVDIVIENDVIFSNTSMAELYETGLIGGKAIAILPDYKNDSLFAKDGDYLKGTLKPGLTELVNQILPQVQLQLESVMQNAEVVFKNINNIFDDQTKNQLKSSISDFSDLTLSLSSTSKKISKLIDNSSPKIEDAINDFKYTSENLKSITSSFTKSQIDELTSGISQLINNLNMVSENLNNSNGTMGMLIQDKSIYENLEKATNELKILIEDVKLNPDRYVNFSVFGKNKKEFKKNN